jgi:hypothetical protein
MDVRMRTLILVLGVLLSLGRPAFSLTYDDVKTLIGWDALNTEVSGYRPTGDGVGVQHVEAPSGAAYMPNVSYFPTHVFIDRTLMNRGSSTHATNVAYNWYGADGISPGVGITSANAINSYSAGNWLSKVLNGSYSQLTGSVINNSWIGGSDQVATDLNKIDYYIKTRNVLMFAAVNNGTGSNSSETAVIPWATYNGITVGLYNGNSKSGRPNLNYCTASKPDLVAPPAISDFTSYAAPVAAGVGSMLLESARDRNFTDATKPDTIKAMMLAGASKSDNWTRTDTSPLDPVYGAGVVNVLNSYNILASGKQTAGNTVFSPNTGWTRANISYTDPQYYFFSIDLGVGNVSAALTWLDPGADESDNHTLDNNLNVALYSATFNGSTFTADTLLQQSISSQDNVEVLWKKSLTPGYYALKVWAADTTTNLDYSLAWITNPGTAYIPGDANRDGMVDICDYSALTTSYRESGKSWLDGDFTGDGLVSIEDYSILTTNYGSGVLLGASGGSSSSVPEPATFIFLVFGSLTFGLLRKRN